MVLASFKPGVGQLSSTPVFVLKPTMQHYMALFTGGYLVKGLTLDAVTGE